jgi:hypothetical protein
MDWKIGLNFFATKAILFTPNDLDNEELKKEIENDKYHIYLICKRKKIFFETSYIDGGDTKTILYWLDDKHNKQYLPNISPSAFKINSFNDGIYNIDNNVSQNALIRDYDLINLFTFLDKDFFGTSIGEPLPSDLEVMYIGQAFGRTETKKIDYRLENHDKIQKIAIDILNKGSNEEVLVIGIKIEVKDLATSFVTINSNTKAPTVEDLLELQKKATMRIPEAQEITVFEASLIRYFQPKLNTEYKKTFPSPHISYEEIFNTEFDYSAMEINTRLVLARIFSEFRPERKYHHTQHYPLKTKSDKETLFEFLIEISDDGDTSKK